MNISIKVSIFFCLNNNLNTIWLPCAVYLSPGIRMSCCCRAPTGCQEVFVSCRYALVRELQARAMRKFLGGKEFKGSRVLGF